MPNWGLFLLLIGFPFLGIPFIIFGVFLGSLVMTSLSYLFFLFVPAALFLLWLLSAGTILHRILQSADRPTASFNLFRFNIFFALGYLVLTFIYMFVAFNSEVLFQYLFLPAHLYQLFCLLHGIYFVSRNLATVEKQEADENYIGYFFLLLLFPVGLWFIQPKINSLTQY